MNADKPASPLRYTMRCAGCHGDIEVCPSELNDMLVVCPNCHLPMPTPIYALLKNERSK
ncbi:hypothetical protein OAU50_06565 [Planctomycetota bacterium]|nr:hypothetical protein [Planctomycetota bacterium]